MDDGPATEGSVDAAGAAALASPEGSNCGERESKRWRRTFLQPRDGHFRCGQSWPTQAAFLLAPAAFCTLRRSGFSFFGTNTIVKRRRPVSCCHLVALVLLLLAVALGSLHGHSTTGDGRSRRLAGKVIDEHVCCCRFDACQTEVVVHVGLLPNEVVLLRQGTKNYVLLRFVRQRLPHARQA